MAFDIIEMTPTDSSQGTCSVSGPDGCEYCGHCVMLRAMLMRNLGKQAANKKPSAESPEWRLQGSESASL